jgi:hypothetical protein
MILIINQQANGKGPHPTPTVGPVGDGPPPAPMRRHRPVDRRQVARYGVTCSQPKCDEPNYDSGLCKLHYERQQWQRQHGQPTTATTLNKKRRKRNKAKGRDRPGLQ